MLTLAAERALRRSTKGGFSPWMRWSAREEYEHDESPGIYILAHLDRPRGGAANPLSSRVIYIGETGRSFQNRWNEFQRSAGGGSGHGGGDTYHSKYRKPRKVPDYLYVSALPIERRKGRNLRNLTKLIVKLYEDKLLYEFLVRYRRLPDCNRVTQILSGN